MKRHPSLTALLLLLPLALAAQETEARRETPKWLRPLMAVKNFIDSGAVRGIDQRYISAPKLPWQVIAKWNVNQSALKMKTSGSVYDEETELSLPFTATPYLKTEPSQYVGFWVGYRGYGAGYSVNVAGDKGSYLTFGALGGAYAVSVRIHNFENDNPNFELTSSLIDEEDESWQKWKLESPIKVRSVIASAIYLFNGKHFSYAAAYDQSVIQKRSAGSFMVGASYYYGHINYADSTNAGLIYLMQNAGRIKLWQASVGAGYAYNWVPFRGMLVSVMGMPMLTFVNRIKGYAYQTNVEDLIEEDWFLDPDISDEEWDRTFYKKARIEYLGSQSSNSGLAVNFDVRLSLTYNFDRYFLNACGQFYNFQYNSDDSRGYLNDWYINASIGVRL
jgi:hypothetical protein